MEQEQILSEIKTRLGQTNLSDRTLTGYISENLPAEEPDDAYWNKHIKVLNTLQGQYNHDVATKVEEFKKNYKPQQEPPKPDEKTPETESELLKRLEAVETQLANEKKTNTLNGLRDGLKAKADGLKVANKAIWNDIVSTISIEDNSTIDTLLPNAKTAYEAKLKEYIGEGVSPYKGDLTPPKPDSTALDSFFAQKVAEGKFPKTE